MNDYGFELLSARPFDWQALIDDGLFSPDKLEHDILVSLNASELCGGRRPNAQGKAIARIRVRSEPLVYQP
jgi:hypothetical protein